ncbi:hypothetical protein OPV22_015226 [Ensete ventricosum]|uniref:Uncharacterized protein n=1 Tax=Ensete ventricosum TaxID=4639 RepID=A0AAV8R9E1_ENSVE|nr:hypothetical protein OPV22_015226 [Ensete ventricosum]
MDPDPIRASWGLLREYGCRWRASPSSLVCHLAAIATLAGGMYAESASPCRLLAYRKKMVSTGSCQRKILLGRTSLSVISLNWKTHNLMNICLATPLRYKIWTIETCLILREALDPCDELQNAKRLCRILNGLVSGWGTSCEAPSRKPQSCILMRDLFPARWMIAMLVIEERTISLATH